jgi:hypothetical protein
MPVTKKKDKEANPAAAGRSKQFGKATGMLQTGQTSGMGFGAGTLPSKEAFLTLFRRHSRLPSSQIRSDPLG